MRKKVEANAKRPRLVLLDSHAIIHRAYHAIPDFTSSKGEPTGALYGLTSMLLRIIDELKPDYIVAARDLPGPTHRHEQFAAYKATRMKADDALIAQLERAPMIFKGFGIPLYEHPGFEADDCIGTIIREMEAHDGVDTIIASGDMDTLQLVSPTVRAYTLRKGLSDTVLFDEEGVRARYGFGPEHVVDYKALRGDPSDNIPGIRGIGEKTATELIAAFGSIENLYKELEKNPDALIQKSIKPRIIELLKLGKEDALFSKQLATIRTDVPIQFSLPPKKWLLEDHAESISALCDELDFRSLKERVRMALRKGEVKEEDIEDLDGEETLDPRALKETAVALWLIRSDTTNPKLEDIYTYARTRDFEAARALIFKELKSTGKLEEVYETIEKPLISIVEKMGEVGICLDTAYLKKLAKEYNTGLREIAARIYAHAGREFNINSPKQLGEVLFDELKITLARQKKTAGGARTTREDELIKMTALHPIVADILAYRELAKLLSTYIEKMPAMVGKDKRLHAEFLQAGSSTGRMASQNPGLQNIPIKTESGRRIRSAFTADKGFTLASIDYSQIELRVAAGLSGDKKFVRVFKDGGDVHAAVASEVFGVAPKDVDREMRRRAKVINFGILYGMGVNALRSNLGESVSRDEAATYLSKYFEDFSGLAQYLDEIKISATRLGYTETMYGRRRYFAGLKSSLPGLRAAAERMAINAPIQGTAADIIKLAMVEVEKMIEKKKLREKVRLLLQVHDELVFEVAEGEEENLVPQLRIIMESVVSKDQLHGVPIVAEAKMGKNWGAMTAVQ
jgi:DNA polymerase-1